MLTYKPLGGIFRVNKVMHTVISVLFLKKYLAEQLSWISYAIPTKNKDTIIKKKIYKTRRENMHLFSFYVVVVVVVVVRLQPLIIIYCTTIIV